MKRTAATLIAAMLVSTSLVACSKPESDGIDTGVVISKTRKRVTVLEDDGEKDTHRSRSAARKCKIGDRWPDCANKR